MDGGNTTPTNTSTESKEVTFSTRPPAVASEAQTISWTASNTKQINQSGGPQASTGSSGHGRSSSVGSGKTQAAVDTGQIEGERRHSEFHPPLLPRSQLPRFLDLISSVDDPNDKHRIPPISYPNDGNSHVANSSPIRKQHICSACKKSFPSKNSLSKHKQIHGERSHMCGDCNAKFHTKKDLTRHRDTVHGENSSSYVCPVPDCARSNPKKAFSRRDNLRQHIVQLHDKRYLEEIRNPQASSQASGLQDRNSSRSPEEYEQNDEEMQSQTIDEIIGDPQEERSITRSRSPIQITMGDADSESDDPDENSMLVKGRAKGKEVQEALQTENSMKVQLRSHSPYDQDESQDIIMTTPGIVVQDFGTTSAQDPLPEVEAPPSVAGNKAESINPSRLLQDEPDESWVVNFLEGISVTELETALKLSHTGLKERFPLLNTENKLKSVRSALAIFTAGFHKGYTTAQANISEAIAAVGPAATSKASLPALSPPSLTTESGKFVFGPLAKAAFSPITPTSIASVSPATPHIPKGSASESAFFGVTTRKDPERGEQEKFVVPAAVPSRITRTNFDNTLKAEDSRPPTVATEADNSLEIFQCPEKKCLKRFNKKSEFKKHMQRHRRPFYCTFHWQERGEVQRFGSKDDWRRHEEHRHYQSEFYKCPGGSHDSCRGSWPGRQEFERHLDEHHQADVSGWKSPTGTIDEEKKSDFFKANHNGTDYVEDNYWCGFCAKLMPIPPEMTGRRGKEIRVNHVADHFHKGEKDILEWVKYNDCDQSLYLTEIENAQAACRSERKRSNENESDALDPHRNLPSIKHIVGNLGEFNPSSLGPPPTAPEFWICCECKILLQSRPDFAYALNLPKDKECGSNDHERHERCTRCSIA